MDDVQRFMSDFAAAWRDERFTRLLCYAVVTALILYLVAGAVSDMTRPRVYVVRGEVPGDGR